MSKQLAVGIDLGGTGIKFGLVDPFGTIIESVRLVTPSKSDPAEVATLIGEQAKALIASVGRKRIVGVGIGAAGDVAPETGLIRISPNLRWHNVPLKKLIRKHLSVPITIENDANVAAWAAYVVEAKRKVRCLVCVTLGTGVGGGIVLSGSLHRGATGSAGEIGHMTLFPDGKPCNCGNHGCLERYIGARAMIEEAARAIRQGESSRLKRLMDQDHGQVTPLMIAEAARQGDPLAKRLWHDAGERLGIALASLINILNPEQIVLAGGLSRSGHLLLQPLRRTIAERAFSTPAAAAKIVVSRLDQDLGTVGAGLIAHEEFAPRARRAKGPMKR